MKTITAEEEIELLRLALGNADRACLEMAQKLGLKTGYGDTVAHMIEELTEQILLCFGSQESIK